VHVKAKAFGDETELSWIPRNLDNMEAADPNAQIEIRWTDGAMTVVGTSARLPIALGLGTSVTLTPLSLCLSKLHGKKPLYITWRREIFHG